MRSAGFDDGLAGPVGFDFLLAKDVGFDDGFIEQVGFDFVGATPVGFGDPFTKAVLFVGFAVLLNDATAVLFVVLFVHGVGPPF